MKIEHASYLLFLQSQVHVSIMAPFGPYVWEAPWVGGGLTLDSGCSFSLLAITAVNAVLYLLCLASTTEPSSPRTISLLYIY